MKKYYLLLLMQLVTFSVIADIGTSTQEVNTLLQRLVNEDEFSKLNTTREIVSIGKPALPALHRALKSEQETIRAASADILGQLGDTSVTDTLLKMLLTDSIIVSRSAAVSIGRFKNPNNVKSLLQAYKKRPEFHVREKIIWALTHLGDTTIVPFLISKLEKEPLSTEKLAMTDFGFTHSLIWALGHLKDKRATPVLIKFSHNKDKEIRQSAIIALSELKDPSTLEYFVKLLKDPDPRVALYSARYIGSLGGIETVEPLLISLNRLETKVVRASALALGKIGDPRALDPLILRLKDKQVKQARYEIVESLSMFKHPKAIKALENIINDKTSYNDADGRFIREAAEKGLKSMR